MDQHDKLDDVVEAKNEFSGNIMKRFVGRREYETEKFQAASVASPRGRPESADGV